MKENPKNRHPYDTIIHLSRPIFSSREPMAMHDRAAQFSPFAALKGYDESIQETARLTDQAVELDETEKTLLDQKLRIVEEQLSRQQEIEIIFFRPDEIKAGGAFISVVGAVKTIERHNRTVIMQDGTSVNVEAIIAITGEMFQSVDDCFA